MEHYIRTFKGHKFFPLDPNPEAIDIEDIAHALSLNCRWTGHVREHYSVGQHSIWVAYMVDSAHRLSALLHDASEAYLSDVARPVKHHPDFEFYRIAEKRLEEAIQAKYGLFAGMTEQIRTADNRMLATEKRDLVNGEAGTVTGVDLPPYDFKIVPKPPKEVENMFLKLFEIYGGKQ